MNGHNEPKLQ